MSVDEEWYVVGWTCGEKEEKFSEKIHSLEEAKEILVDTKKFCPAAKLYYNAEISIEMEI